MNVPQLGFCSSTVWVPTPFICNQSLIKMSFRWAIRFERIFLDLFTAFNDMIILYFIYIYCATKWRNLHASGACSYKSYLRRCCLKHHITRESAKRMEHYISRHTFNKNRTKQNITVFFLDFVAKIQITNLLSLCKNMRYHTMYEYMFENTIDFVF